MDTIKQKSPGQEEIAFSRASMQDLRLTLSEKQFLKRIDDCLMLGLELKSWLHVADVQGQVPWFELAQTCRGHTIQGFRANVRLEGLGELPVLGAIQEFPFIWPKLDGYSPEALTWICHQVRSFVLRHFLQISARLRPQPYPQLGHASLPLLLEMFSWCPAHGVLKSGVKFKRVYYKTVQGQVGKFGPEEQFRFDDLSKIGRDYQWIVISADLFDETFDIQMSGPGSPTLVIPKKRTETFVLSPKTVYDQTGEGIEFLGTYGFTLNLVGKPHSRLDIAGPSLTELLFLVSRLGQVKVRTVFAFRQPEEGFGRAVPGYNRITGDLDLSRLLSPLNPSSYLSSTELQKLLLLKRCRQLYELVLSTLPIWNQVPDWTKSDPISNSNSLSSQA